VSAGADTLVRGLESGWERSDPADLVAQWPARLAELQAADPDVAHAAAAYGAAIAGASDPASLLDRFAAALGRERGDLTRALSELPALPLEQRRTRGRALNLAKRLLEELHEAARARLERAAEGRDAIDVTLPGRRPWIGRRHVLNQIYDELLDLFHGLGYSVFTSPEVEHDSYNFGKLNFPPDHPARDAHDTYFVGGDLLLRTHTSPGWFGAVEERKAPLRLVFPGRVYRAAVIDASLMDLLH